MGRKMPVDRHKAPWPKDSPLSPKRDPPERDAQISKCGKYRYWLMRHWDYELKPAGFVMLNPSTADALVDDPTVRKCVEFARAWGCGGIEVVNLFALRATDPRELVRHKGDVVGPENDDAIRSVLKHCDPIVAAWGNNVPRKYLARVEAVKRLMREVGRPVWCLKKNQNGSPGHPLYIKGDAPFLTFYYDT